MSPPKFTAFDRDGETVTAIPESPDDDEVEFDATIADRDEEDAGKGNWEDLIGQMFEYDDGQAVEFDGTSASLSSRDAISAVVESDDEFVMTRHQAEAVLEYLNSEEILDIADSGSVTVVKSFESIEESGALRMCNNWAAMFDTFITRIDTANEKVEEVKRKLDNREVDIQQRDGSDKQQKQERYAQKLRNLLNGRSPSELNEKESQEFEFYRKQYEYHETLEKSESRIDR